MITARELGLAVCRSCGRLTASPGEDCRLCGTRTSLRMSGSLQRVWAFWTAAVIAYIPGNLYPIMISRTVGGDEPSTIIGGVIALADHGSYAIAFVIFAASILVPVSKFMTIAWLALSVQRGWIVDDHQRHRAHRIIEFVGRWSMIDVFVVATLAALIQLGAIATLLPGAGVGPFALSVVFSMLSATSLDPRLIWDRPSREGS